MLDHYILDENGNVVKCDSLMEWAKWHETADRNVARTKFGPYTVSTVFLGLDHGWGSSSDDPNYQPVLFESMVFHEDHGGQDFDCDRYCTKDDALTGHWEMVSKWRQNWSKEWKKAQKKGKKK